MIILDTNIWYRISEGSIPRHSFKEDEVCLTGMFLLEIMTTNRWNFARTEMIKVLELILDMKPHFIQFLHYEYIAIKIMGFDPNQFGFIDYGLIEDSLIGRINQKDRDLFIETRKEFTEDFVENYNKRTSEILEDFELLQKMKNYSEFIPLLANDVFSEVENISKVKREDVDRNYIDREGVNLDLYLRTRYIYYFKTIFEGIKPKPNDAFDLLNLAYVGVNDLYWTRDKKKWINRYMQDPLIEKFLYIE